MFRSRPLGRTDDDLHRLRHPLDQAVPPFVLALDVGSTGTRGGLFDGAGRPVRGLRVKIPHAFTTMANGTSTIDPDQVTDEIRECIDVVASDMKLPITGVAIDTFASSLVGVDSDGTPAPPATPTRIPGAHRRSGICDRS